MSTSTVSLVSTGSPEIVQPMTSDRGRQILDRVRIAMSNATLENIDPHVIRRMEGQPRKTFNQARLQMLSESIRSSGQMMPGIIRRIVCDRQGHEYELCDGERRWRAVLLGEVGVYRALVIEIDDEAAQYVVSIITNFNRENLSLLELVDSVVRMHNELKLTIAEVAANVSMSAGYVQNLFGLRRLHPEVRDMLDPNLTKKTLSTQVAFEIMTLPEGHQLDLARRVMSGQVKGRFVRREVLAISHKAGLPTREMAVHPSDRRKSIDSRIETLSNAVEELETIFKRKDTARAVLEWPSSHIEALMRSLAFSGKNLTNLYESLEALNKVKKKNAR